MGGAIAKMAMVGLAVGLGVSCGSAPPQIERPLAWQTAPFFNPPPEPDPAAEELMQRYLSNLRQRGFSPDTQGVFLQADLTRLAVHEGTTLRSAASLTKIATTLAALEKWGLGYRFPTLIYGTGPIAEGRLNGDLIIEGSGSPFFVWEEAIALGNALNDLGIREITGKLVIVGPFYMNYRTDPHVAGNLLRTALDARGWPGEVQALHGALPPGTAKPQIVIRGAVITSPPIPSATLLLRHQSVNLANILKQMNIYSNNVMSEVLAQAAGGADAVAELAADTAGVPSGEIRLINGSGLGVANRITPRATVAMLIALEQDLATQSASLADLFPVAGRDRAGTLRDRNFPNGTLLKTGTLNSVSTLAGVLPTRDRGWVWFALMNNNGDLLQYRAQQDLFLQTLAEEWGSVPLESGVGGIPDEPLGDPLRIERP